MKQTKIKLAVVGLGGVGGFYGGLLAHKYQADSTIEIHFIARGAHLQAMQQHGLEVRSKGATFTAIPSSATAAIQELGTLDFILLCTKEYDLAETIKQLKPCVGANTIILPLLNGITAYENLAEAFPEATVWKGCTYMVSELVKPGVVENLSGRQKIVFGLDTGVTEAMSFYEKLFQDAGIKAYVSDEISTAVWEKYLLVSASATATSYFDACIGQVMQDHADAVEQLLKEGAALAKHKQIALPLDVTTLILDRLRAIPFDSTTSMHRDFIAAKNHNELDVMAGYIVKETTLYGASCPTYSKMYNALRTK